MSFTSFKRSRSRSVTKEDYYTKKEIVSSLADEYIIPLIRKHKLKWFVDFSAGDAYLSEYIGKYIKCINIDKYPAQGPRVPIFKEDFLKLKSVPKLPDNESSIVGFNPPFGRNGKMAIQFIEHAIKIVQPEFIACILPHAAAVRNYTTMKPILTKPLNGCSFYSVKEKRNVNVPSIFVIFQKTNDAEQVEAKVVPDTPDFIDEICTFTSKCSVEGKLILLRRIGNNCGKNGWFKISDTYYEFRLGKLTGETRKQRPRVLDETHLVIYLNNSVTKSRVLEMIECLALYRTENNTKRTFSKSDILMSLMDV